MTNYQVPTGSVNDIIILLTMLSKIGEMYHRKNSKTVVKGVPTLEENSVEFMNELINLYSQYDHKTNPKAHKIENTSE